MKRIRLGTYCIYENLTFEFIHEDKLCTLIRRGSCPEYLKRLGFQLYTDSVYTLDLCRSAIKSAYRVSTFCNYKGFKCSMIAIDNHIAYLYPSAEYQTMSGDHAMHGYDPKLHVLENNIDNIWEERTPLEGFKFDTEPIVYIKKDGVWLVEE